MTFRSNLPKATALAILWLALAISPSRVLGATLIPKVEALSGIWVNDGADKVVRDEIRSKAVTDLTNSVWNGSVVTITGARNEIVNFNLILESATREASGISVRFDQLTGPDGFTIATTPTGSVFDYRSRDIELFYVRYLKIRGIGGVSYGLYNENHIPQKLRRPQDSNGKFIGGWQDRPYADKMFPDIAVPLALESPFSIKAGENQSIWADIYIPRDAPAGTYNGVVLVSDGKHETQVPVQLKVHDFSLPDTNSAKTMLWASMDDIALRYTGKPPPEPQTPVAKNLLTILAEHYKLAKRHRVTLFGGEDAAIGFSIDDGQPPESLIPFLDGSAFTPANGYRGPGLNTGTGFYSIGTYGSWRSWSGKATQEALHRHTNAWESWFQTNLPDTERLLYIVDEPQRRDYGKAQRIACWVDENPGPGSALNTLVTIPLDHAATSMRSVDVPAALVGFAQTDKYQAAYKKLKAAGKQIFLYNGIRPGSGTFATEDDGISLRELPWGQYKMGVDRWFYWQSTYYNDFQNKRGQTNLFTTAQTFGAPTRFDETFGQQGHNATNGDGVLFYPGTDRLFPEHSYDINGPIASLRLKHWRRGLQDVEYLAMAKAKDPKATDAIVSRMVPRVLWEVNVDSSSDPTYTNLPVSWSNDPDDWEKARDDLARIITRKPSR